MAPAVPDHRAQRARAAAGSALILTAAFPLPGLLLPASCTRGHEVETVHPARRARLSLSIHRRSGRHFRRAVHAEKAARETTSKSPCTGRGGVLASPRRSVHLWGSLNAVCHVKPAASLSLQNDNHRRPRNDNGSNRRYPSRFNKWRRGPGAAPYSQRVRGGPAYTWGPDVRGGLGARRCRGQSEEPCAWRESHTGSRAPGTPRPQRLARRALRVQRRERSAPRWVEKHRAVRAGLGAPTEARPSEIGRAHV